MSEHNSSGRNQLVKLLAPAVIAFIACVFAVIIYGGQQAKERDHAANTQREISIAKCLSFDPFIFDPACVKEALGTKYGDTSEVYDLKAQQEMAMWALLMLIVTSVGVYYVVLTIRAATEANEGFKVAAEKQLRAYLSVTPTGIIISPNMSADFPQEAPVTFKVAVKNDGQTPAHDVKVWANIVYDEIPIPAGYSDRFTENLSHNDVINPGQTKYFQFDKLVRFYDRGIWETPPKSFILCGVVRYKTFDQDKCVRFTGHIQNLRDWWLKIRNGENTTVQFESAKHGNDAN